MVGRTFQTIRSDTASSKLRSGLPSKCGLPVRRAAGLWGLLGLQVACALFFIADVAADFLGIDETWAGIDHGLFEAVVALVLVLSIAFTAYEIHKVLKRNRRIESQLRVASGAFIQLLEGNFDAWALTPSERDVALLAVKGLSIAEIAALRQTKDGTIKAQCNAIYRKAGVTGRPQLLSLFIEQLFGDGLLAPAGAAPVEIEAPQRDAAA